MVKKHLDNPANIRKNSEPIPVGDCVFALLEAMGGSKERSRLSGLWQAWPEVLGEDVAGTVEVLGHKNGILQLGVEDSMQMQEMLYQVEDILAKVNAFLGSAYFKDIRLEVVKRGQ